MNPIESSSALHKISKIINKLKKDETIQLINLHGDTVEKIRDLMNESGITAEQLQILLKVRPVKEKGITKAPRKTKRKTDSNLDLEYSVESVQ